MGQQCRECLQAASHGIASLVFRCSSTSVLYRQCLRGIIRHPWRQSHSLRGRCARHSQLSAQHSTLLLCRIHLQRLSCSPKTAAAATPLLSSWQAHHCAQQAASLPSAACMAVRHPQRLGFRHGRLSSRQTVRSSRCLHTPCFLLTRRSVTPAAGAAAWRLCRCGASQCCSLAAPTPAQLHELRQKHTDAHTRLYSPAILAFAAIMPSICTMGCTCRFQLLASRMHLAATPLQLLLLGKFCPDSSYHPSRDSYSCTKGLKGAARS